MKPHPSGRPIHREEKRSYSMAGGFPRQGFICPRLNETIRPRHDTYAVGFMAGPEPREDLHWYTEAKR